MISVMLETRDKTCSDMGKILFLSVHLVAKNRKINNLIEKRIDKLLQQFTHMDHDQQLILLCYIQ